jgi:hypothetical protein
VVIAVGYTVVLDLMPLAGAGRWGEVIWDLALVGLAYGVGNYLFVLAFKWLLLGRYKKRADPMWTPFVWLSEGVTNMYEGIAVPNFMRYLRGTPWLPLAFNLLGCRIGKGVYMDTTDITEFDCVHIGDHSELNALSCPQTHLFEDRVMKIDRVDIGSKVYIGPRSAVLYSAKVGDNARIGPLTLVMKGEHIPAATAGAACRRRRSGLELAMASFRFLPLDADCAGRRSLAARAWFLVAGDGLSVSCRNWRGCRHRRHRHPGPGRPRAARLAIRAAIVDALSQLSGLPPQRIILHAEPGEAPWALLDAPAGQRRAWLAISHDGALSVAAISLHGAVGIDVTQVIDIPDWQPVARDYLGPDVAAALAALPARARARLRPRLERARGAPEMPGPRAERMERGRRPRCWRLPLPALSLPEGYVGPSPCRRAQPAPSACNPGKIADG